MSHDFRYFLRVRYGECDAQKVVFNVHYGHYVDLAVLEFLRALGLADQMVSGPFDYQLVKQTIEWRGSARFDQVLEITIRPLKLGNTSFSLAADFRLDGEPHVLAAAETVYVLVDAAKLTKTALPEDIRTRLAAGIDTITDHAQRRHGT